MSNRLLILQVFLRVILIKDLLVYKAFISNSSIRNIFKENKMDLNINKKVFKKIHFKWLFKNLLKQFSRFSKWFSKFCKKLNDFETFL